MQKLTKFKVIFDLFTVCVYFIQQQNCKLYYIYLMIISEIQSEIGHCSCDSAKFKAPADFSHHAILCMTLSLRFLSTLWPILQVIVHHIQDKLTASFDSSSIGLISYKWFLTIYAKYSSVKTYNEEDSFFLEKKISFLNFPNPSSACIF